MTTEQDFAVKGNTEQPKRAASIMDADVESTGRLETQATNETVSPLIDFKTLTWW